MVVDEDCYTLLGRVLGKGSMHMLSDHKAEIGHRHYLGPQLKIWNCYEHNTLYVRCEDECLQFKAAGLPVDV